MDTKFSFFEKLNDSEAKQLLDNANIRTFPKNTIVFSEGDDGSNLYLVISGRVKVFLSDDDGKEIDINFHGAGENFGELAILGCDQRTASVMTLESTKLAAISKQVFQKFLKDHPEQAYVIIQGLCKQLAKLTDNVKSLALLDIYGRVARLLIRSSEESDNGEKIINERLTHQKIADQIGSSREMVSRIMKDLKAGGYVDTVDKKIIIKGALPKNW